MAEINFGRREVYRSTRMAGGVPVLQIDFEMDRRGMRRVALGEELRTRVAAIALRALPYAVSISPRDTGAYSRAFEVSEGYTWVAGMRRVAARLVNTDPAAAAIEFGTSRQWTSRFGASTATVTTPAHRVLQKTLSHLSRVHLGTPTVPSAG